jgi:hypothetical protein
MDLVGDNYLIIWGPCGCNGDPECGCWERKTVTGHLDLGPLLHNLAVAGALTRAGRLGREQGLGHVDAWRPNTEGRAA